MQNPHEALKAWLEDNCAMETELHFDNEGKVSSQEVLTVVEDKEIAAREVTYLLSYLRRKGLLAIGEYPELEKQIDNALLAAVKANL